MKSTNNTKKQFALIASVLGAYVCLVLISVIGIVSLKVENRLLRKSVEFYKTKSDYLFNAANDRNLLTFCGEPIEIKFKDDCK